MTAQPANQGSTMSNQPTDPQPSQQTIIVVQQREIDRINSNRVFLLATIEETNAAANAEIGRLMGVVSQLQSLVPKSAVAEAEAIIAGTTPEPVAPQG